MSITTNKTTIALAASAVLTAGLALSPTLASADTNPFASAELSSGYMQLAEGKCGENMKEAKCGGDKKAEGKCGENMDKGHEGKCGENMKKSEGKCGEAKCGADKKKAEGKCGEAKCGANKK
ncbi:MAG: low-complexity protein [Gammaproteobacteria bacterium]|nr:MAG: low-complexity protein [Gammaproteobacteria bacterium]RKZ96424.1 MAG: low-complexity protein [Gammaproteobacteria bacterium]